MKLPGPEHPITIARNKGDANYCSMTAGSRTSDNAVWSYEQPYPAVAEIAGFLAFYRNRVDGIEESPV
jgi:uncharacterized protein (DUF427 family)